MIDEDWNLLDSAFGQDMDEIKEDMLDKGIPDEGVLDEMQDILLDDYEELLRNNLDDSSEKPLTSENQDSFEDESDLFRDIDLLLQEVGVDVTPDSEEVSSASYGESFEGESQEESGFAFEGFEEFLEPMQGEEEQTFESAERTQNVSDVLKESLGAVSTLEDELLEEQFNNLLPDQDKAEQREERSENKQGFLHKLFANVDDENDTLESFQEEERLRLEKKEEKKRNKEKKKKEKDEIKANKAALKEAKKLENAKRKEEKRKAKEAEEAAYVPEGKINKVGAGIVIAACACIGFFILFNTNRHSYKVSVQDAKTYVLTGHYTEAYQKLSGLAIKDEDKEFFEQVQTVMLLNKQLNSYYNFKELGMEVEALDSLLKGLTRYDTYYESAKLKGVENDFIALKNQIVSELQNNYAISEGDANVIRTISNANEYTEKLISLLN